MTRDFDHPRPGGAPQHGASIGERVDRLDVRLMEVDRRLDEIDAFRKNAIPMLKALGDDMNRLLAELKSLASLINGDVPPPGSLS